MSTKWVTAIGIIILTYLEGRNDLYSTINLFLYGKCIQNPLITKKTITAAGALKIPYKIHLHI